MPPDSSSSPTPARRGAPVLCTFVDAGASEEMLHQIGTWGANRESRSVYFVNVHSVVTARSDSALRRAFDRGDLLAPDGHPVAWTLRRRGYPAQKRVAGPDSMARLLEQCARDGQSVFFFGETETTLQRMRNALARQHPGLHVAGMISPPFRPLTDSEDQAIVEEINASRANVVFVALGCPKQEKWIDAHKGRIHAPMLGVGIAFAFHAGVVPRAPRWMHGLGLEWIHRLCCEPRRLAGRYLVTNSIFLLRTIADMTRQFVARRTPVNPAAH